MRVAMIAPLSPLVATTTNGQTGILQVVWNCRRFLVPDGRVRMQFYLSLHLADAFELRMNAQQNTAKPKRKRDKWGTSKRALNTPPTQQALVVGLSIVGKKRSAISRELGLDRETVTRILSQHENQELVQGFRDAIFKIVPDALISAYHLVKQGLPQMTRDILYGTGVLFRHHGHKHVEEPKQTFAYPRAEFYRKYGRWPRNSELKEFEKTLDTKPLAKGERQRIERAGRVRVSS